MVGASCHDERELARRAALGLDFVVLGPVRDDAEPPRRAAALGWRTLRRARPRIIPLPVFALGGIGRRISMRARCTARTVIAMMRGAWALCLTRAYGCPASLSMSVVLLRPAGCDRLRSPTGRGRSACSARSRTAGTGSPAPYHWSMPHCGQRT